MTPEHWTSVLDLEDAQGMIRYALNHPEESGYLNRDWLELFKFIRVVSFDDWIELQRTFDRGKTIA